MSKLLLTLVATTVLLLKLAPIDVLSTAASALSFSTNDLPDLKTSLLLHAAAGLFLLLAATALAVYKPAGLTSRGAAILPRRGAGGLEGDDPAARWPRWVRHFAAIGCLVLLALLAMLLFGRHGPSAHLL